MDRSSELGTDGMHDIGSTGTSGELSNVSGSVTHLLGAVTTRGKRPLADIVKEAERHMATVNRGAIPAERIVTIGDFVERVYLPSIERGSDTERKRPSTVKGYRDIWEDHLRPLCGQFWLRDARTYQVQGWLDQIGQGTLSRNTLKHIKSVVSGIFTLAKRKDYFEGENPARETGINPGVAEPQETYAYTLHEIHSVLAQLSEPAATAFAVAAFMGLRHGEIQGLLWEDYHDGEMYIPLDLERPNHAAQDSQGACARTGDSATGRAAGNAQAAFGQPAERPNIR